MKSDKINDHGAAVKFYVVHVVLENDAGLTIDLYEEEVVVESLIMREHS